MQLLLLISGKGVYRGGTVLLPWISSLFIFFKDLFYWRVVDLRASQGALVVKNPPTSAEDARNMRAIPGSGRYPGGGNGNPVQYSCLENFRDWEVGWSLGLQKVGHHWMTEHHSWFRVFYFLLYTKVIQLYVYIYIYIYILSHIL